MHGACATDPAAMAWKIHRVPASIFQKASPKARPMSMPTTTSAGECLPRATRDHPTTAANLPDRQPTTRGTWHAARGTRHAAPACVLRAFVSSSKHRVIACRALAGGGFCACCITGTSRAHHGHMRTKAGLRRACIHCKLVVPEEHHRSVATLAAQPNKNRSIIFEWRSIRFQLPICTYDAPPWQMS